MPVRKSRDIYAKDDCDELPKATDSSYLDANDDNENAEQKKDETGFTMLHDAAAKGRTEDIATVIEGNFCDIDCLSKQKETALFVAAKNNHVETVEELLKFGASPQIVNENGLTPLHIASLHGYHKVVSVLARSKGVDVNAVSAEDESTPLHYAAKSGHTKVVAILIKNGANVDAVQKDGSASLFLAAKLNHLEVVELLVSAGCDINYQNEKGDCISALHVAAFKGNENVVSFLISKGAKLNSTDSIGLTPLHLACETGHFDVVKLLIEAKADVNATDETNCTPINLAEKEQHCDIVDYLQKSQVDKFTPMNFPKPAPIKDAKKAEDSDKSKSSVIQVSINELPKDDNVEKPSPCSYFFKCICCCFCRD